MTEQRIPVMLVTGFLGSGKTTLVNRILKARAYARAAVVVNEFGEVSVDHVLLDAPRQRTRIIDGGCLCGHVHEEVATSLLDLAGQRNDGPENGFDRVVIETSGFADPVPIVQVLLTDGAVTDLFELRSVVTVADGVHGQRHLDLHPESTKQAAVADFMVLSKMDLAASAGLDALGGRLASINPGARQFRIAHGEVDATLLEGSGYALTEKSDEARAWLSDASYASVTPVAGADPLIRTFTITHPGEITIPGFVLWMNLLAGFRGAGLLRVKGIVNVEGRPYAVQAVQTIVSEPVALDKWPEDSDRQSRLVFITRGMDEPQIRRTLTAFRFEGGRDKRNLIIRPETYARFRDALQLFR